MPERYIPNATSSNASSSNRPVAIPAVPPTLPRTTTSNVISGSAGDSASNQATVDTSIPPLAARSLSISGASASGTFGLDSLSLEAGAIGGAAPPSTLPGGGTGVRTTRFMMEGVGARVIRGPDWKWGKQVSLKIFPLAMYLMHHDDILCWLFLINF